MSKGFAVFFKSTFRIFVIAIIGLEITQPWTIRHKFNSYLGNVITHFLQYCQLKIHLVYQENSSNPCFRTTRINVQSLRNFRQFATSTKKNQKSCRMDKMIFFFSITKFTNFQSFHTNLDLLFQIRVHQFFRQNVMSTQN